MDLTHVVSKKITVKARWAFFFTRGKKAYIAASNGGRPFAVVVASKTSNQEVVASGQEQPQNVLLFTPSLLGGYKVSQ